MVYEDSSCITELDQDRLQKLGQGYHYYRGRNVPVGVYYYLRMLSGPMLILECTSLGGPSMYLKSFPTKAEAEHWIHKNIKQFTREE